MYYTTYSAHCQGKIIFFLNFYQCYDSKEFILDIEIVLNGDTLLNLEMQVVNQHNWTDRSLSYLCRRFDPLKQGEDYINCRPAIHIGFLDFTPFRRKTALYIQENAIFD